MLTILMSGPSDDFVRGVRGHRIHTEGLDGSLAIICFLPHRHMDQDPTDVGCSADERDARAGAQRGLAV